MRMDEGIGWLVGGCEYGQMDGMVNCEWRNCMVNKMDRLSGWMDF